MEVDDERIPDDLFASFLRRMPQVSVELVLERDGSVLLVRRTNEPAKGEWFWPGSRLYKGERLRDGARRLAREELDTDVDLCCRVGVYGHRWESGNLPDVETAHTVNVVYHAHLPERMDTIELDDQHRAYRFVDTIDPDFHDYVKRYIQDTDCLEIV